MRALLPGLPRDHPESYHSFMWNNFFKHIDILAENVHILDGNAADLQAECDAFEDKIKAAGGIELFVGGENLKGWQEALPFLYQLSHLLSREFIFKAVQCICRERHLIHWFAECTCVLVALFFDVPFPQFKCFNSVNELFREWLTGEPVRARILPNIKRITITCVNS